jgi:serine/threonine protein kinase
MAEPIRKLGPYTLVSRIGRGGFGVVWLAEKRTAITTTQFALKLPRGEDIDLEALKQEAAIWTQASGHPNVLPLIEADIYDDQVVIVSEYVPDGSLAGWLKEHGGKAPSAEAACEIIDGVLAGLAHLHARRIIHRDLKPENILLQRETPRLADFGIARLLKSSSHSAKVSGTLAYMAPEAFDGKRTEQTDVWSVGVIFYQLLTGRVPYDQPDTPSFIGAIMRHDPPPLPLSVPEVVRQIVMSALQRDGANRYSSAAEMRRDLREAERLLWLGERKARESLPETIEDVHANPVLPAHRSLKVYRSASTVASWMCGIAVAAILLVAVFGHIPTNRVPTVRYSLALAAFLLSLFFLGGRLLKGTLKGLVLSTAVGLVLFAIVRLSYRPSNTATIAPPATVATPSPVSAGDSSGATLSPSPPSTQGTDLVLARPMATPSPSPTPPKRRSKEPPSRMKSIFGKMKGIFGDNRRTNRRTNSNEP